MASHMADHLGSQQLTIYVPVVTTDLVDPQVSMHNEIYPPWFPYSHVPRTADKGYTVAVEEITVDLGKLNSLEERQAFLEQIEALQGNIQNQQDEFQAAQVYGENITKESHEQLKPEYGELARHYYSLFHCCENYQKSQSPQTLAENRNYFYYLNQAKQHWEESLDGRSFPFEDERFLTHYGAEKFLTLAPEFKKLADYYSALHHGQEPAEKDVPKKADFKEVNLSYDFTSAVLQHWKETGAELAHIKEQARTGAMKPALDQLQQVQSKVLTWVKQSGEQRPLALLPDALAKRLKEKLSKQATNPSSEEVLAVLPTPATVQANPLPISWMLEGLGDMVLPPDRYPRSNDSPKPPDPEGIALAIGMVEIVASAQGSPEQGQVINANRGTWELGKHSEMYPLADLVRAQQNELQTTPPKPVSRIMASQQNPVPSRKPGGGPAAPPSHRAVGDPGYSFGHRFGRSRPVGGR